MNKMNIKGNCPIYEVGDFFKIIDGFKLNANKNICMHSFSSIFPYYVALSKGISSEDLGLSKNNVNDSAFVQCLDPCEITQGGTVTFEIILKNQEE